MKKLALALAAVLGFTVLAPSTAEAGCASRITYDSCGYVLHWEYRHIGCDCHGWPIYRWVVVSRCAPAPVYSYGGYYGGGYCGSGSYRGGYYGGGGYYRGGHYDRHCH